MQPVDDNEPESRPQRPAPLRPHHRGAAGHRHRGGGVAGRQRWRRRRRRPAAPTRPPAPDRRAARGRRHLVDGAGAGPRRRASPTPATPSPGRSPSRSSSAPSASPSSTATTAAPRRRGSPATRSRSSPGCRTTTTRSSARAPGARHRRLGRRGPRDLRGLRRDLPGYYQTYGRTVDLEFVAGVGLHARPGRGPGRRRAGGGARSRSPSSAGPLLGQHVDRGAARPWHRLHGLPGHRPRPAPSSFGILPSNGQIRTHVANYVGEKLGGQPAEFAGEDLQDEDRVFGSSSWHRATPTSERAERMLETLQDEGVDVAETVTYPLDPGRASELAASAIARCKEAGVTTVMLRADPITAAGVHQRGHEAELVPRVGARRRQFIDTTTFARTFDQEQWPHTFGISFMPPLAEPEITPGLQAVRVVLRRRRRPPDNSAACSSTRRWRCSSRARSTPGPSSPSRRSTTACSPSRRRPERRDPALRRLRPGHLETRTDYAGIDDMVELWWDPDATGPTRRARTATACTATSTGAALPARRVHERAQGVRRGGVA